ncbi:hypothetical protein BCR32DRAFT_327296 [Anaeromyces robustus]|uniref:Phosphatidyl-N-methylethanolamine N-methyltransferase n=1 Tax=Anaeromyces robustus TaxID=1754192 RepID=A0A1Y1X732_9FUNG|nr:hypothetical protein BCR32DRAFT_327296 [Anaeromyces robustus]|eukprot:ORX81522.1 hypothetical protein BCR32DRAFT_327296 [Anaeromyces robustus]
MPGDIIARILTSVQTKEFAVALFWIVLHVAHYNITAHIEHKTRIFTKLLGKNAVYYYAVLLIVWACVRDWYIMKALEVDEDSLVIFSKFVAKIIGGIISLLGFGINLWTLSALGVKGMYNGDSFGYLFDEPITTGPYQYMSDPQYVGTFIAAIGSAIMYQSIAGYVLAFALYAVFLFSVKFVEGPHMRKLYSQKQKKSE